MAATIAFFGFLSMVPLVLLLLAFVGDVLGGLIPDRDIRRLFHGVVPGLSERQFLQTYWYPMRHSKVATTVLGVVSLFLGSLGLHDAVDWAVNKLWNSPSPRGFWMSKLRGAAVIIWVSGFAVLSLGLTSLWTLLLGVARAGGLNALWLALLPSLLIDIGIFTALYKLTPTVPVRVSSALQGALAGAALWECSKVFFGWWVLQMGTYNRVYGPLAASVIVMLWLWVSAIIFLFGSALSVIAQRRLESLEAGKDP
jgi:membrane protein